MTLLNLSGPIQWLFAMHALCGALALVFLLVPMLSKKGGKLHVRAGWVYAVLMIIVGVSAILITPWRAFFDPERNTSSQNFAVFLFFIAVLTLSSLWFGIAALRAKKRKEATREWKYILPPILLATSALVVELVGLSDQDTLLITFPLLAVYIVRLQLLYWLNAPQEKMHWWYAHMSGMGTACISTITAFLVTALPRMFTIPSLLTPVLWIGPGIILGTLFNRWAKKYRAQFKDE